MTRLIRNLAIAASFLLFASVAMADPLGDAKASGKLGEGPDGYLHVVNHSSDDVESLAKTINAKRRSKYEGIASKQGVPLDAVAAQAGKKLLERTPPGEFVMDATGKWSRK